MSYYKQTISNIINYKVDFTLSIYLIIVRNLKNKIKALNTLNLFLEETLITSNNTLL